ncbi:hypothetical protein [Actinoplanes sp. M2I2]|uniref:hypothetical protein n=1 Tax=Actinoplanes sp. M2I2 TaxID=1734444 RepID=UPI002021ADD2|nr:hypothetical protein [Actinoplanes sp. M2I2]
MYHNLGRRLALGAVALAAAAAVGVAAPAQAAGPAITIGMLDTRVPQGPGYAGVRAIMFSDQPISVPRAQLTFELSAGLEGIRVSDSQGECSSAFKPMYTCDYRFGFKLGPDSLSLPSPEGPYPSLSPELIASSEAKVGQTGTITMTLTAEGLAPVTKTAKVTVVEKVDLSAAGPRDPELTVKRGSSFDQTHQVRNESDKVVHGAVVTLDRGDLYGTTDPKRFSNCLYRGDQVSACTFDQDLQPGTTYEVRLPRRLRPDVPAPVKLSESIRWMTPADFDDLVESYDQLRNPPFGDEGNGGTLSLTPVMSAARRADQTDGSRGNESQILTITSAGKQGTDFAALGTEAKAAEGDTVSVPVGLRNHGPATLDSGYIPQNPNGYVPGLPAAAAVVTFPADTEVVEVPKLCVDGHRLASRPDAVTPRYLCRSSSRLFKTGTTETWTFGVKLTAELRNAEGLVESNPACCALFTRDINTKNDTAKIVFNPLSAGGPGTGNGDGTGGGPGSGGEGGTGGEGGGLPITGPQTGLLGGAAAVLIAAGAFGFVLARRRRTRFEA